MSLTISKPYLAGKAPYSFSIGSSKWQTLSREGNLYDTVALLLAAGDHCVGDRGFGQPGMQFLIRTVTSSGTDGAGVGYKLDTTATPSGVGAADEIVSGSGQTLIDSGPFKIVWFYPLTGGDTIKFDLRY